MTNLLSVIVPTYRRPRLCLETVRSILAQDYAPIEVIVVNDGDSESEYSPVKMLDVTYMRFEDNCGVSAARNAGAGIAAGEFLAFVDDDDKWLPGFANTLLQALTDDAADVVYGAGMYATGQRLDHCYPFDLDLLIRRNFITPSATVMRTEAFRAMGGFDEKCHQDGRNAPEDWDLWIRLAQHGYRFVQCDIIGMVLGTDPDSLCNQSWRSGEMERGLEYLSQKLGVKLGC